MPRRRALPGGVLRAALLAPLLAPILVPILAVSACGSTSGIVPVGPDTYALTEMRAEALGGGAEAHAAVAAGMADFCRGQGRLVRVLDLRPGGDPRGLYWPTAFSATFQCVGAPTGGFVGGPVAALSARPGTGRPDTNGEPR